MLQDDSADYDGNTAVPHDAFSLVPLAASEFYHRPCRAALPKEKRNGIIDVSDRQTQPDGKKRSSSVIQTAEVYAVNHIVEQQQDLGYDTRYCHFPQQGRDIPV